MRFCSYLLVFLLSVVNLYGQETVSIMTWNLLNFYTSSSDCVPHYQTILDSIRPDILVVQEIRDGLCAIMAQFSAGG